MSNYILSEQLSFYGLFESKKLNIQIPIIQRDYAQGRKNADSIREGFLNALFEYLNNYNGESKDLDFVYGDIENNCLIPLDGQQRLTTLFLLHWYLAAQEEGTYKHFIELMYQNNQSRFSYKTRFSSSDFCNGLLKNSIDLNALCQPDSNKSNALSKTIKDSCWFFNSWKNDPTVASMLRMLDAIHYKFNATSGFYNLLIDPAKPAITFQFLPISTFGSSNDLYIKMNSRGKPLSRFENFKAQFEKLLSDEPFKTKHYDLSLGSIKQSVKTQEYFAHKIDTQWTDLFWLFKEQKVIRNTDELIFDIDRLFMNFFATVAINHAALSQSKVRKLIDNQENLPFSFYLELDDKFPVHLITLLDILSSDSTNNKELTLFLSNSDYYNEKDTFKKIIYKDFNDAAYWERIQFFAYYSFLIQFNGNSEGLFEWMRVITNLSKNTMPYNNDEEFTASIKSINSLVKQGDVIYQFLKDSNSKIDGFDKEQIKEERIKAHLITKNEEWKSKILECEKHPYFKGQITFALAFAGIEDFYDENKNCSWDPELNQQYFTSFSNYISKVFAIFDHSGLVAEADKNHRLHRAILSKGDYLIYSKSNWSFLNKSDRDVSWKRFLLGDGDRKNKRVHFKAVMDDPMYDNLDMSSLDAIINACISDIPTWCKAFINYPELFNSLGDFKFIRYDDEYNINLLKGFRMSGEHAEFYSYLFYLKNKSIFSSVKEIDYYPVSGFNLNDLPCCYINLLGNKNFAIDIRFFNKQYEIRFFNRDSYVFEDELIQLLNNKTMVLSNKYDDMSYFAYRNDDEEVKSMIIELCSEISSLYN